MKRSVYGLFIGLVSLYAEEPPSLDIPLDFPIPKSSILRNTFGGEKLFWKNGPSKMNNVFMRTDKNSVLHGHVQDSKLTWEWGFRNGVKYDDFQEDWSLSATYTHFHSKSFTSQQRDGFLLPLWEEARGASLDNSWRLDLEIADLEVGKTFQLIDFLSVRPHLGARTTWVYQKFDVDPQIAISEGFFKDPALWNNCLGVGARTGLDTLWNLGDGLKFFGDGAISWLTGYHNVHQRQSLVEIGSSDGEVRPNAAIAIAEVSCGFQYDLGLFNFRCGYEMSYFFNKNRWADWFSPGPREEGKISLQGISLSLGLAF